MGKYIKILPSFGAIGGEEDWVFFKREVDDLTNMMKDLKIYQLENQRKFNEQMMESRT